MRRLGAPEVLRVSLRSTNPIESCFSTTRQTAGHVKRWRNSDQAWRWAGSGVAEGACRHLVKDRMELTGMHWRVPGAQAMLDLREVYVNGDWDDFQEHRIEQERRRLYPYRSRMLRMRKQVA